MSDLFIRKATGLVRAWSVWDAFIYAAFSINLVTLGFYIFSQMYFLEGGLIPTLVISAIFILFEVVVYAGLIAVMPRSGGDYVWQSRILGGAVGFILAVTGWWFILWLWVPIYGDMLRHIVLTPLLGLFGAKDTALWFGQSELGLFVTSLITLALVSVFVGAGMQWYARIQRFTFWAGTVGLVAVIAIFAFGSPDAFKAGLESNSVALFGAAPGVYDATMAAGEAAGGVLPISGGSLAAIFLAMPYLVFFNLYPNWGATLYGEVRGATDFKRNFWGMAAALIFTTILAVLFAWSVERGIGWDFYVKANAAYWNSAWGLTDQAAPLPYWPNPALFAAFFFENRAIQILIVGLISLWWFGWSGTLFLSSTRVIFAAAFDRLLPEKVAEIEPRTRTPLYALILMVVPSIFISYLFAYDIWGFRSLTLASTLVIGVTYLGTAIAAMILPYIKKDLYNASPIVKYQVLGIPLITIAGAVFSAFCLFLLYQWFFDPNALYGIGYSINENGYKNGTSLIFIGSLYAIAAAIYFGFKAYRKSKGIDIEKVHQEIPAE